MCWKNNWSPSARQSYLCYWQSLPGRLRVKSKLLLSSPASQAQLKNFFADRIRVAVEQLGLKLQPEKLSLDITVIDHGRAAKRNLTPPIGSPLYSWPFALGSGAGVGIRGSISARVAALYANHASIMELCITSAFCTRSYVSALEWWVRGAVLQPITLLETDAVQAPMSTKKEDESVRHLGS